MDCPLFFWFSWSYKFIVFALLFFPLFVYFPAHKLAPSYFCFLFYHLLSLFSLFFGIHPVLYALYNFFFYTAWGVLCKFFIQILFFLWKLAIFFAFFCFFRRTMVCAKKIYFFRFLYLELYGVTAPKVQKRSKNEHPP